MSSTSPTATKKVRSSEARALVLDGHSRAAVETVQSLGRHGIRIDVAAEQEDCVAFHSRHALHKFRQPPSQHASRLSSWIHDLDRDNAYRLIVPSTEFSLRAFQEMPDSDPLRRKAVLAGTEQLRIALDKRRTYELADQLGILYPRTRIVRVEDAPTTLSGFPVVLKPSHSAAVIDKAIATLPPILVRNPEQRAQALKQLNVATEVLEQEYVEGYGIGIEMLFQDGRMLWHFMHERIHEYPLSGGASTYRRSAAPDAALIEIAEQLLQRLNWHGVAMVEFRVAPERKLYLMEINPRLWGSLALAIDAGVDFPWGLFQIANGQQFPEEQRDYRVGYYTRALAEDVKWQIDNLRADHKDPTLLTKSRTMALLGMLRPLIGRESWDHFDWHDLGPTRFVVQGILRLYKGALQRKVSAIALGRQLVRRHNQVLKEIAQKKLRPRRILFLCYGNICRSPVAEQLARRTLPNLQIESAGFHLKSGRCCPDNIRKTAAEFGLEMSNFRSARIEGEQLSKADLVLVMDAENYLQLQQEFPGAIDKTMFLGMFASDAALNITDPYGKSEQETAKVLSRIQSAIIGLRQQLFLSSQAAAN